jgi:hypothetical protein
MRVAMASSRGHPDRQNEDFVGAVPGAVVLLDGAGIPGSEAVCHHGVAWYAHRLGAVLLERLFDEVGVELVAALADSIRHVAELHRRTCDIASPISPQASVAIVRFAGDRADYLVLADVFVVLDLAGGGPQVVTDPREISVRNECMSALRGVPTGTSEYEQVLSSVRDDFRARRNRPGGFWVAKDDPHAATQAVTGSVTLERFHGVALLSNGASRVVTPYQLAEWPAVIDLLRTGGPEEILRRVRTAEKNARASGSSSGTCAPDDATVAFCEPATVPGSVSSE